MTMQAKLDDLMSELSDDFMNSLDDTASDVADKVARIRADIYDILEDYSKKDDRISKSRINSLLRKLDAIDYEIYSELSSEIEREIKVAIEQAEKNSKKALIGLLGIALIPRINSEEIVDNTLNYVMNRKIAGDNTLPDIIRSVSGLIRDELQSGIRYGIQRGESITKIGGRIREAFKSTAWQIKRIVKTELPIAFRKTISYIGGKLGIIKAVKINDNRGRHRYHESHECYRLAEQDMYGWGKGVYRTEDTFIFDPHPQCTAYFQFILVDDVLTEVDADAN